MACLGAGGHHRRHAADRLRRERGALPIDGRTVVRDAGHDHVGRLPAHQPSPRAQTVEDHPPVLFSGTFRMLSDPITTQPAKTPTTTATPPGRPSVHAP